MEFAPLLWSCSDALRRLQIGFGKVGVEAGLCLDLGNSGAMGAPYNGCLISWGGGYALALIQRIKFFIYFFAAYGVENGMTFYSLGSYSLSPYMFTHAS